MFKAFFRRSLGDSQAFVDIYWGKIKRDSQHQLEEILDWTAHPEHLQAVLREFNPAATLNEETMIRYFRESLRPSIQAYLDTRGQNQDSWKKTVKKAVNAKAKALLQSSSSIRDMDSRCFRGNRPAKKEEKDSGGKNKSTDSLSSDTSSGKQSSSTQQTSSANPKKTSTTNKEVLGTKGVDKDRLVAMTLLQRMSTPPPSRMRRKISLKLSVTTVTKRDITPPSIPKS